MTGASSAWPITVWPPATCQFRSHQRRPYLRGHLRCFRDCHHGRRDRRADDRQFRRDRWWPGRHTDLILAGLKTTIVNKSGGTITGGAYSIENGGVGKPVGGEPRQDQGHHRRWRAKDKIVNDGTIKGEVLSRPRQRHLQERRRPRRQGLWRRRQRHADRRTAQGPVRLRYGAERRDQCRPGQALRSRHRQAPPLPSHLRGAQRAGNPHQRGVPQGPAAHDGDDHIIYNKHTGALYYDPDGTGSTSPRSSSPSSTRGSTSTPAISW